jgi:hypothetical protein
MAGFQNQVRWVHAMRSYGVWVRPEPLPSEAEGPERRGRDRMIVDARVATRFGAA